MKGFIPILFGAMLIVILAGTPAWALKDHVSIVPSPDHEQTFAYGSERSRVWAAREGRLILYLKFTNDPYVDREDPRLYDDFTFRFPSVKVGADGQTFYYTKGGRFIPVAVRRRDFFGVNEIKLLPNSTLVVLEPHGALSLFLIVSDVK